MISCLCWVHGEAVDLFILCGQSNAQGWQGNAEHYPADPEQLDQHIPLFYTSPGIGNSGLKWVTMQAQKGRFPKGHFGLEVTMARGLKKAGYRPAFFKYSKGSTSLYRNWKTNGEKGMYDRMVGELQQAISQLQEKYDQVNIRAFIWVQGESDANNQQNAENYEGLLKKMLGHLRETVCQNKALPILLGVDEAHPWVVKNPQVIKAQQQIASEDPAIVYTSMVGLEKADVTHLSPKGLEAHGERMLAAYLKLHEALRSEKE